MRASYSSFLNELAGYIRDLSKARFIICDGFRQRFAERLGERRRCDNAVHRARGWIGRAKVPESQHELEGVKADLQEIAVEWTPLIVIAVP